MSLEPLIMLPGLLCDERLFAAQLAPLRELAQVTVADLTRDDTIAGMARRVLERAPERFALAGLSMGGYVALEIMRQAPGRVSRLALMDTQARPDTAEASAMRRDLTALVGRGGFRGVSSRLMPRLLHAERLQDEDLVETVKAMAEAVGKDGFLRQQEAIIGRIDSRPHLPAIACPTLVLCGREDVLTAPELHLEMAAAIPQATLVVIPRAGHLAPMERPEPVTAQLRLWLRG
ncbi:alpha/beta fold hydrolase [Geminicoccaceae bacterium 1502E]|nr:alpha/beta fold hydrolase [Geminicoccaceae bacterium 1502E]